MIENILHVLHSVLLMHFYVSMISNLQRQNSFFLFVQMITRSWVLCTLIKMSLLIRFIASVSRKGGKRDLCSTEFLDDCWCWKK